MANRSPSINLASTGSAIIYTPDLSDKVYIIRNIIVLCTAASGVVTPATISIGTNASSFNNILAATALTGLLTANSYFSARLGLGLAISRTVPIQVNVTSAITGTSQTAAIFLDGFYG